MTPIGTNWWPRGERVEGFFGLLDQLVDAHAKIGPRKLGVQETRLLSDLLFRAERLAVFLPTPRRGKVAKTRVMAGGSIGGIDP